MITFTDIQSFIQQYGFTFVNKTEIHPSPQSFYNVISNALWKSAKHPKSARKEVCNFQSDKGQTQFQVFEPEPRTVSPQITANSPEELFTNSINRSRQYDTYPEKRDMYAASILLGREIHMYYKENNEMYVYRFGKFSHSRGQQDALSPILVLRITCDANSFDYAEIQTSAASNSTKITRSIGHDNCHRTVFRKIVPESLYISSGQRSTSIIDKQWGIDDAIKIDKWTLFRCISKTLFDNEDLHKFVHNLVVGFEEGNKELVVSLNELSTPTDNQAQMPDTEWKMYIEKLKNATKSNWFPELYILATLFVTDIYVFASQQGTWHLYQPTCPFSGIAKTDSYITLLYDDTSKHYKLLEPNGKVCNCEVVKPHITGRFPQMMMSSRSMFLKRVTCHPSGRRRDHVHLGPKKDNEIRRPYDGGIATDPVTQLALVMLEKEDRCLDVVGSFEGSIEKEINGGDSQEMQNNKTQVDVQAQADSLGAPIYVFEMVQSLMSSELTAQWRCYQPVKRRDTKCRYYITLYRHMENSTELFDRITPSSGCNCELDPPLSNRGIRREINDIPVTDHHHPRLEMYLDEPPTQQLSNDAVRSPYITENDELFEILLRPDMGNRTLDQIGSQKSFYACLSKCTFGTERHADFVQRCIQNEVLTNKRYAELSVDDSSSDAKKAAAVNTIGRSVCDVAIMAAATFLQTEIYVLLMDGTSSYWQEYIPVRKVEKPKKLPSRQSRCASNGTRLNYFISMFKDPLGNFWGVVPKGEVCNCECDRPVSGDDARVGFAHKDHVTSGYRKLQNVFGMLKTSIDEYLDLVEFTIITCNQMIAKCEGHRSNINGAVIGGTSVGLAGGVLAIVGFALGPVTFGAGYGLMIAGGVIGGAGGLTSAGSHIFELVNTKMNKDFFGVLEGLMKEKYEDVEMVSNQLDETMDAFIKEYSELGGFQDYIGNMPSLTRTLLGSHFIPLVVARLATRVVTTVVGVVLSAAGILLDLGIMIHAIWSLKTGNRTSFTDALRLNVQKLITLKQAMHISIYGNTDNTKL